MEDQKFVFLKDLKEIFEEKEYIYFGHGVGRAQNEIEVVESIFREGLRTKNNSLYYTTIGLDIENLETTLNHWEHLDSKQIILIRLPIEYMNRLGESSDLDGERFGAFYKEVYQNEKKTYYLEPKFIIGCYNSEQEHVLLNPQFEKELTEYTRQILKERYAKCLEKTKARLKRQEDILNSEMFFHEKTVDWGLDEFDDKDWMLK